MEGFEFSRDFRIWRLERFDLHAVYEHDNRERKCRRFAIPSGDSFPAVWGWLSQAQYVGQHRFGHLNIDFWNATVTVGPAPGLQLRLALGVQDLGSKPATRPIVFARRWTDPRSGRVEERVLEFVEWDTQTPPAQIFDVPPDCPKSSMVAAVRQTDYPYATARYAPYFLH